jgi:hypothetical protein
MKPYLLFLFTILSYIIVATLWYSDFTDDNYDVPWIQFDSSGKTIRGISKYIGEGSGFEGGPDENPSVILNKYNNKISAEYIGADNARLSISYEANGAAQSINYIGKAEQWYFYRNGGNLSITTTIGNVTYETEYNIKNKLESKNIYHNNNLDTPWSGLKSYLLTKHQWCFEKYKDGEKIIARCNLSIADVNLMYRNNSNKTNFDYEKYVNELCHKFQQQVIQEMNIPKLLDETYDSLLAKYFSLTKN